MHVFLELVTQFEYLYTKTIVMDIAISFGKWRGSQLTCIKSVIYFLKKGDWFNFLRHKQLIIVSLINMGFAKYCA
jgi:hypothetical protein